MQHAPNSRMLFMQYTPTTISIMQDTLAQKKGSQDTVGGGHEYKSNQERSAKLISAVAITVTVRDG
jgi:hypothetical protein